MFTTVVITDICDPCCTVLPKGYRFVGRAIVLLFKRLLKKKAATQEQDWLEYSHSY